ncbi:MAG: ParA family protein, partial [Ruminococcus sp.]|nr:ParA family protein [Ruminococcus sp.]
MATVIVVTNQKGGVGKTTTCSALTGIFRSRDKRVLAIDMDPQGNLSFFHFIDMTGISNQGMRKSITLLGNNACRYKFRLRRRRIVQHIGQQFVFNFQSLRPVKISHQITVFFPQFFIVFPYLFQFFKIIIN